MSVESDLAWIDRCRSVEEAWRGRARKVIELYRDEKRGDNTTVRFNILWANTEAMKPALYSATPEPVVRRRYLDADPLGKQIAIVLERALEYFEDCEDFDTQAKRLRDDVLLPGRGVIKVHYVPTMAYGDPPKIQVVPVMDDIGQIKAYSDGTNEYAEAKEGDNGFYVEGEPEEEVVDETVAFERVPWDLFVVDPQRAWADATKIAFGAFMDEGDLKRYFGRKAVEVSFTHSSTEVEGESYSGREKKYALVWEIWDKRKKEVRWVCKGYPKYLSKTKDPLKLQGFFPTPEPVYAVNGNDTLVPIPLYTLYQDQARELDIVTARLYKIIDAMRVRGFYAGGNQAELAQLFESEDLALIPVQNWTAVADKGGLENMIAWLPIEQLQKAAMALYQHRQALIESIYEVTGMSDILRGATDPRETKGAQVLKAGYASRRLIEIQQNIQRYFRDLLRIAGEIVCEHFSPEAITRITGQPCTPEMKQLMQDDAMRSYRLDIETDSTIAPDEQRDKEQAVEAVGAMGQFMEMVAPLVQQGQLSPQVAGQALQWFIRKFRMGRDLEDFVAAMEQQPPQQPRDPEAEAKAQAIMQDAQLEMQKAQVQSQVKMQELELKKKEMEFEMALEKIRLDNELELERLKAEQELAIERQRAELDEGRKERESQAKIAAAGDGKGGTQFVSGKALAKAMGDIQQALLQLRAPRRVVKDDNGDIIGVE